MPTMIKSDAMPNEADAGAPRRRILVLSSPFPSVVAPTSGVFVKNRVRAVADLPGYEVRVVSAIPYFPPIKLFKRWHVFSQYPREEVVDGLEVRRPRYPLLPKLGGRFESALMYPSVRRAVERIRRDFDFDLIDAHWVYPAGVVGARLAQRYGKPLIVTGRGVDILHSPGVPVIGDRIRDAVRKATHFVALSPEIARAFESNGAEPDAISVIPNGVDCQTFHPIPQAEARRAVGLPDERPVVLSVGSREERKGFHLLVDAIGKIRDRFPNVLLAIVGGTLTFGKDYTSVIRDRVRANGLEEHVRLVDRCSQGDLARWYSAADLFALLSSREGSPNVVLESLACGTPVVATPVGGIPDELEDSQRGILLSERSSDAAAVTIADGLSRLWDRSYIRRSMEGRSWQSTAQKVSEVFDRALRSAQSRTRRLAYNVD